MSEPMLSEADLDEILDRARIPCPTEHLDDVRDLVAALRETRRVLARSETALEGLASSWLDDHRAEIDAALGRTKRQCNHYPGQERCDWCKP